MIAIIIPTLNRPECMRDVYAHLMEQTHRGWLAILVNQSDERTRIREPNIFEVHCPGMRGSSIARNLGVEIARSMRVEYVCFWDDDDHPSPLYLDRMVSAFDSDMETIMSCCLIEYGGAVQYRGHTSTASRVILLSAVTPDKRWDALGPGQDRRWWRQWPNAKTVYVDEVLYRVGNKLAGGLQDPDGRY